MSEYGLSIGYTAQRGLFIDLTWKGSRFAWELRRALRIRRCNPMRPVTVVFSGRDVRRAALYRR